MLGSPDYCGTWQIAVSRQWSNNMQYATTVEWTLRHADEHYSRRLYGVNPKAGSYAMDPMTENTTEDKVHNYNYNKTRQSCGMESTVKYRVLHLLYRVDPTEWTLQQTSTDTRPMGSATTSEAPDVPIAPITPMRLSRSHRAQVAQYEWTLLQTDNCGVDHMAEPHSSGHYDSCGADRQTCTVYVTLLVQDHRNYVGRDSRADVFDEDQVSEEEMFSNVETPKAFEEFLDMKGNKVKLKGFHGGLDTVNDQTGEYSCYTTHKDKDIMFHVLHPPPLSTLLPYNATDSQQVPAQGHIGNDIVVLVFLQDKNATFCPCIIRSHFIHSYIVVQVEYPNTDHVVYKVAMAAKNDDGQFDPPLLHPTVFQKGPEFREWLLTKLLNAEVSCHRAPDFQKLATRTQLFNQLVDEVTHYRDDIDGVKSFAFRLLRENDPMTVIGSAPDLAIPSTSRQGYGHHDRSTTSGSSAEDHHVGKEPPVVDMPPTSQSSKKVKRRFTFKRDKKKSKGTQDTIEESLEHTRGFRKAFNSSPSPNTTDGQNSENSSLASNFALRLSVPSDLHNLNHSNSASVENVSDCTSSVLEGKSKLRGSVSAEFKTQEVRVPFQVEVEVVDGGEEGRQGWSHDSQPRVQQSQVTMEVSSNVGGSGDGGSGDGGSGDGGSGDGGSGDGGSGDGGSGDGGSGDGGSGDGGSGDGGSGDGGSGDGGSGDGGSGDGCSGDGGSGDGGSGDGGSGDGGSGDGGSGDGGSGDGGSGDGGSGDGVGVGGSSGDGGSGDGGSGDGGSGDGGSGDGGSVDGGSGDGGSGDGGSGVGGSGDGGSGSSGSGICRSGETFPSLPRPPSPCSRQRHQLPHPPDHHSMSPSSSNSTPTKTKTVTISRRISKSHAPCKLPTQKDILSRYGHASVSSDMGVAVTLRDVKEMEVAHAQSSSDLVLSSGNSYVSMPALNGMPMLPLEVARPMTSLWFMSSSSPKVSNEKAPKVLDDEEMLFKTCSTESLISVIENSHKASLVQKLIAKVTKLQEQNNKLWKENAKLTLMNKVKVAKYKGLKQQLEDSTRLISELKKFRPEFV
ncbi:hypothetical protein EMCRGX_G012265 [Ephydatia muelleri]